MNNPLPQRPGVKPATDGLWLRLPAGPTSSGDLIEATGEAVNNEVPVAWVNKSTLGGPGGGGDMVLADVQSVTGLKTFDSTKFAVKGSSTGVTAIASDNASGTDYTLTLPVADGVFVHTDSSNLTTLTGASANGSAAILVENTDAAASVTGSKFVRIMMMGPTGFGTTGWESAGVMETFGDGGLAISSYTGGFRIQTGSNRDIRLSIDNSGTSTFTGTVAASNLSGTNTGDQDLSGYSLTSHNHSGDYEPADATLTALSGANWAENSIPVGSGVDTVSQVTLAVNQFLARSSTGNAVAKPVTDAAFSVLDDATVDDMLTTLGGAASSGTGGLVRRTGSTMTANPASANALTIAANTTNSATKALLRIENVSNSLVHGLYADATVNLGAGKLTYDGTTFVMKRASNGPILQLNNTKTATNLDSLGFDLFNDASYMAGVRATYFGGTSGSWASLDLHASGDITNPCMTIRNRTGDKKYAAIRSDMLFGFASTANSSGTFDSGISRLASGSFGFGTGESNAVNGKITVQNIKFGTYAAIGAEVLVGTVQFETADGTTRKLGIFA